MKDQAIEWAQKVWVPIVLAALGYFTVQANQKADKVENYSQDLANTVVAMQRDIYGKNGQPPRVPVVVQVKRIDKRVTFLELSRGSSRRDRSLGSVARPDTTDPGPIEVLGRVVSAPARFLVALWKNTTGR